jgi:hypothetical protein
MGQHRDGCAEVTIEKGHVMNRFHCSWLKAFWPLSLGAFLLAISPEGRAGTPPPWYPGINSVGHIIFYNAQGQVVTGGLITDHPFAQYMVASSKDYRTVDTKATVFAYTPVLGVPQDAWSGAEMTVSTIFPGLYTCTGAFGTTCISNAPAPLATTPEPSAASDPSEWSIADYVSVYPNTATSGSYAGLYELRMKVSGPGVPPGPQYWNTVISVDATAGTWSVYYP